MNRPARRVTLAFALLSLAIAAPAGDLPPRGDDAGVTLVHRGFEGEIGEGVRALLRESVRRASSDLSRPYGYDRSDDTRLPLPSAVVPPMAVLRAAGYGGISDPLMRDLNRALELAAANAGPVFDQAIAGLTFEAPAALLEGVEPVATQRLCGDRDALLAAYGPVVVAALQEVGYPRSLQILVDQYNQIPVLSDIERPDVTAEVSAHGLDGLCGRIAAEERALRNDPVAFRALVSPVPAGAGRDVPAADVPPRKPTRAERQALEGLRELMAMSASRAVTRLARPGGYLKNPAVRIALPGALQPAADALRAAGHDAEVDALAQDINVTAEIAAVMAWPALQAAIAGVNLLDADIVLAGDDTAATQLLRGRAEGTLIAALRPAVVDALRRTGAGDSLRAFLQQAAALGLEKPPPVDLEVYTAGGASDGVFRASGEEEAAIRRDPAGRGNRSLQRLLDGG